MPDGNGSIRLQVFAASPSTRELVEIIQTRFGRLRAQKTPQDFKKKEIRTQRELEPNPNYVPNYWPKPTEPSIDVNLTEEVDHGLQSLLATGDCLETQQHSLVHQ